MSRRIGCKSRGSKKRDDGRSLSEAEFHGEDAVRRKKPPRVGSYCAISVEAIRSAIECKARIEGTDFGIKPCDLPAWNIGRNSRR